VKTKVVDESGKETAASGAELGIPARTSQQMVNMLGWGNYPGAKTGQDQVKVGDKTLSTKWVDYTVSMMGSSTHVKSWRSDEVPGGRVKEESESGGTKTSMIVKRFEVKQ
jgi:hypothetical protein